MQSRIASARARASPAPTKRTQGGLSASNSRMAGESRVTSGRPLATIWNTLLGMTLAALSEIPNIPRHIDPSDPLAELVIRYPFLPAQRRQGSLRKHRADAWRFLAASDEDPLDWGFTQQARGFDDRADAVQGNELPVEQHLQVRAGWLRRTALEEGLFGTDPDVSDGVRSPP